MADIRIKDLATTATTTASDDFMAVDGAINGTRKLSAAAPAFLTSVTTPSLTSPAATPLTLGTGTSGAAITVLSADNNVGIGIITPSNKLTVYDATAQAQAVFSGYSVVGSRTNTDSGTIRIGTSAAFHGRMDYDAGGSTTLSIDNVYDNASAAIQFRLRTAGTPVTALSLSGSGTVSIASTTAGASNAGALVVAGGISAGQSAQASYFGGTVRASNVGALGKANDVVSGGSVNDFGIGTYGTATNIIFATGTGYLERARISDTGLAITGALSTTGAATFAGAVAIGNTTAASVAAPSTHKVSILIGGVQYYLLASNV